MSINTPYIRQEPDVDGVYPPINVGDLTAAHAARTGPENIRRQWQKAGVDNVLDAAWLRENIGEFDDDALISLFVDVTSFAGDGDFEDHVDIILNARPDGWWRE